MIEVVHGGNIAFNAMMFGGPDPTLQAHFANQFNSGMDHLTDYGRQLFDQSKQMFERFNGDSAIRFIKAIGRAATNAWQSDSIRPLSEIGELQWAPPTMQRWIMAEPQTRKMFHEQRLDGFSHSYTDLYPEDIGKTHYDYQCATQGLMTFDETDEPDVPEWTATTYFHEPVEGDVQLTLADQVIIQDTWRWIRHHRQHGKEDWTDRYNASLD